MNKNEASSGWRCDRFLAVAIYWKRNFLPIFVVIQRACSGYRHSEQTQSKYGIDSVHLTHAICIINEVDSVLRDSDAHTGTRSHIATFPTTLIFNSRLIYFMMSACGVRPMEYIRYVSQTDVTSKFNVKVGLDRCHFQLIVSTRQWNDYGCSAGQENP